MGREISTSTIGAAAELRVCAHLLELGYEVFRSMSPNCTCDMVIGKGGIAASVEVKSGARWRDWPSNRENISADILAVVDDCDVSYFVQQVQK